MSELAAPADSPPERADLTAWLAVAAGTMGAFMATLDISVVNASLPTIQGEIGATPAEGTWIGTSYLVAEVIIVPLTAWLERMLGLRRLLLYSATLFTLFSMMCGLATSLQMMILGRIGQGLAGGSLVPTAFTIIATRLPRNQQPVGMALFGGAALMAPSMGPLLGGWLTETFSWHYAFFINLPIGIGMVSLLMIGLPKEKGDWSELWQADWVGIAGMIIGLGCFTVLLEEGHRELWFESALIWKLAIFSAIGFLMIGWGQFNARKPVLELALLRIPALSAVLIMMLVVGTLLFGISYTTPQFLAAIAGYNAEQAGQIVFLGGLSAAMMMPIFPTLIARIDVRLIVGVGLLIAAGASYVTSALTAQSVGSDFIFQQLLMGCGLASVSFSLQQSAISAVGPDKAGESSALFMSARNLGGSIGLALIASFQDQRLHLHRWELHSALDANSLDVQQRVAATTAQYGGGPEGLTAAYRMLDGQVIRDALVMSFNDISVMLVIATLAVIPLVLLLRPLPAGDTPAVMH